MCLDFLFHEKKMSFKVKANENTLVTIIRRLLSGSKLWLLFCLASFARSASSRILVFLLSGTPCPRPLVPLWCTTELPMEIGKSVRAGTPGKIFPLASLRLFFQPPVLESLLGRVRLPSRRRERRGPSLPRRG